MTDRPHIDNAPGLAWKPRKAGWEARWQARFDLTERGFRPKSVGLWTGVNPDPVTVAYIQDQCNFHQHEMLIWGRGGIPVAKKFDGTVQGLIDSYLSDADSPFTKLRYHSRKSYETMFGLVARTQFPDDDGQPQIFGNVQISSLKGRSVLRLHRIWVAERSIQMAHSKMKMLRIAVNFGATILEEEPCAKLAGVLRGMRFEMGKPRSECLSAEQVMAIRTKARELGRPSIALAQAIQFEGTLRQKDVIGEYVPVQEPGISSVTDGSEKWLRGIDWREIDENFVLRHITSKRQKLITIDLRNAPMVVEELNLAIGQHFISPLNRANYPASGPVIINEKTQLPWRALNFRNQWREIATRAGVPKTVKNMDSRAGAITEALEAGASLENVRKTATHSDIGMTQRYSRNDEDATADVMKLRVKGRENKAG